MLGFVFRIQPKQGSPFTVRTVADDVVTAIEKIARDGYCLLTIVSMEVTILKHSPSIYAADIARYFAVAPKATRDDALAWALEMLPGITKENIDTYAAADDFWPRKTT